MFFLKYCKILSEDKKICEQTCGPMLNPIKNVVFFSVIATLLFIELCPPLHIILTGTDTFSRYIYNLHELVNKLLKKKSNLSYCDVRERYEHFRARCTDEHTESTKDINKSTNDPKTNYPKTNYPKTNEKGCTEPLYGKKSKCVLNIVPKEEKVPTFQVDKECIKFR